MSSDFQIEHVGDGAYDLVTATADSVRDFVLIGHTADTHLAATAQRVTYKVGTWLGESPYDPGVGFPWVQAVFGREPVAGIEALLYDKILSAEGVTALYDPPRLAVDNPSRVASITARPQVGEFELPVDQLVVGGAA